MDQGAAAEPRHAFALIALQWQTESTCQNPKKGFYSAQPDLCTVFKQNSRRLLARTAVSRCSALPSAPFVPPRNGRVTTCDWETAVVANREQPARRRRRRPLGANARLPLSSQADWSCFHGTDGVQRNTGDIYLHQASNNQSQQSKRLPEKTL